MSRPPVHLTVKTLLEYRADLGSFADLEQLLTNREMPGRPPDTQRVPVTLTMLFKDGAWDREPFLVEWAQEYEKPQVRPPAPTEPDTDTRGVPLMNSATEPEPFAGWAIVELMGHRVVGGRVSEAQVAGATLLRVDIPRPPTATRDETWVTQYYQPSALYCLTPTDEQSARLAALRSWTPPPHVYEPPADAPGDDDYPF